jgi:subtilisin family serine protease
MYKINTAAFDIHPSLGEYIDYGVKMLNVPKGWAVTKGEGVGVAILDTGVDPLHPDLIPNLKIALDFTHSPNGPRDMVGHGTHVAGIIGANDNQVGIVGIAPRCSLYSLKVLGDNGSGTEGMLLEALNWILANHKDYNIKVVNMSLGGPTPEPRVLNKFLELKKEGLTIICAAGNEGHALSGRSTVGYPARYCENKACISVGAVNDAGTSAPFSSTGPGQVTVVGPGVNVVSTMPGGQYGRMSGTSMATPAIAGLIALLIAAKRPVDSNRNDSIEMDEVTEYLRSIARDLGSPGQDDHYGWGLPVL